MLQQEMTIKCEICDKKYKGFSGMERWSVVEKHTVKSLCGDCSIEIKAYIDMMKQMYTKQFRCPKCDVVMTKNGDHSYECKKHKLMLSVG